MITCRVGPAGADHRYAIRASPVSGSTGPQVRGRVFDDQLECGSDYRVDQMSSSGCGVASGDDDVGVHSRLPVVQRNVSRE
jgi:hypothetical protein